LLFCLVAGAALYGVSRLPQRDIAGAAQAIDGDSLRVDGVEIRLYGIDAPEARQMCRDHHGGEWACGQTATLTMRQLLATGEVDCQSHGQDHYDRALARCTAGDTDLNGEMVRLGLAVTTLEGMALFGDLESQARAAERGIWRGEFDRPSAWREENNS
jgi:endonuclease YncB( thermonuclease family)